MLQGHCLHSKLDPFRIKSNHASVRVFRDSAALDCIAAGLLFKLLQTFSPARSGRVGLIIKSRLRLGLAKVWYELDKTK